MTLFDQIPFANSIQAICLDAEGERIAVVTGDGDPSPDYFAQPHLDQTLHLYRLAHGRLDLEATFPLPPASEWQSDSIEVRFRYDNTFALFLDSHTVLVARSTQPFYADPAKRHSLDEIELFAIDLETGEERGRYLRPNAYFLTGLELAPPHHLLLGVQKTVVCLEADSLREVCLARQIDEQGDPAEEDAIAEESLPPNGFVYDPLRSLLYLQCFYFNEVVLLCYRFEEETPTFVRVSRSPSYESYVASGLCLNPDGSGVTASFLLMDQLLDLQGRPFLDFDFEKALRVARKQQRSGGVPKPQSVPLGSLGIFSDQGEKWIPLYSDFEREFPEAEERIQDPDGTIVHYGYRFGFSGTFMTRPVYLDERRLVVGTPSGFLQQVDVVSGESVVLYDLQTAINALIFCPQQQLLLAGGENGMLTAFSVKP